MAAADKGESVGEVWRAWRDWLFSTKSVGSLLTLGFCAGILILGLGWSALWLVALPLEVFIIYTLLTTLHELGHLVAGWLVGYRFKSLRVGRIKVVATERGLHLQLVAESIWGARSSRARAKVGRAIWARLCSPLGACSLACSYVY